MAKSTCSVEGCKERSRARGMCETRYRRWKKFGISTLEFAVKCKVCGAEFLVSTLQRKVCDGCQVRERAVEDRPRKNRMRCAGCGKWIAKSRTSRPEGLAKCKDCRGSRDKHGTAASYKAGCRCEPCSEGMSAHRREYRERYRAEHGMGPSCAARRRFKEKHGYWPQARYGYDIPQRTRRAVYERDAWVCQICGRPIPREFDPQDRLAPALDHIIPRSAQPIPDHSEENLRMVHHVCNSYRGNTDRSDAEVAALTAQFFEPGGGRYGNSSGNGVHGFEEVPLGGTTGFAGQAVPGD